MDSRLSFFKGYIRTGLKKDYDGHLERLQQMKGVMNVKNSLQSLAKTQRKHRQRREYRQHREAVWLVKENNKIRRRIKQDGSSIPRVSSQDFSRTQIFIRQGIRKSREQCKIQRNTFLANKLQSISPTITHSQFRRFNRMSEQYKFLVSQKRRIEGLAIAHAPCIEDRINLSQIKPLASQYYLIVLIIQSRDFKLIHQRFALLRLELQISCRQKLVTRLTKREHILAHTTTQFNSIAPPRTRKQFQKLASGQQKVPTRISTRPLQEDEINGAIFVFKGGYPRLLPLDQQTMTLRFYSIGSHNQNFLGQASLTTTDNGTASIMSKRGKSQGNMKYRCNLARKSRLEQSTSIPDPSFNA